MLADPVRGTANRSRPDVGAAHPQFGPNHGFDASPVYPYYWEDMYLGVWDVCVEVIDVPTNDNRGNRIGCVPVNITPDMLDEPPSGAGSAGDPRQGVTRATDMSD
jgi:hypothetical protein